MRIPKNITDVVVLNNDLAMPVFGLGVWSSKPGDETYNAVRWALELGYRHVDTAQGYNNESDVGRAVRDSGIPRSEIFVTTKLSKANMGAERAMTTFQESLDRMGFDYVDLFLIHWPSPETRLETWKSLEKIAREKRARAIGVSNYTIRHLEELLAIAEIVPAINQVEFSPFLYQKALLEFSRSRGIRLEAYSPLTRGMKLAHPTVISLAKAYGKSPSQILIRWALQRETVVIPKSANKARIAENADVFDFEINAADMQALDALNEDFRCNPDWNPELEN